MKSCLVLSDLDQRYKAGVRRFPQLVMTEPGMEGVAESRAARDFWAKDWRGQSFMAYGAADPVFTVLPPADHAKRQPVLDRTERIERFDLDPEVYPGRTKVVDAHHRRVADGFKNAGIACHGSPRFDKKNRLRIILCLNTAVNVRAGPIESGASGRRARHALNLICVRPGGRK